MSNAIRAVLCLCFAGELYALALKIEERAKGQNGVFPPWAMAIAAGLILFVLVWKN